MEKKEKKDQFIIAYITDFDQTETVTSYAVYMARMLGKGLILMHISDPKYSRLSPNEAETKLQELRNKTLSDPNLQLSAHNLTYAALKGDTRQIITALPQLLNAVTIVAQVNSKARRSNPTNRRTLLRNFADCKTAFLVAQEPLCDTGRMKDIAMAVDFKKESKDKFIWSSYFPRFGGCRMHILHYDYRDKGLSTKWQANMTQLQKLYDDLGISFESHVMPAPSIFQDINALRYAAANQYGMLIAVTTKEKDGFEFFIGTQDRRTIINNAHIPILFLNPREDLYVLCD